MNERHAVIVGGGISGLSAAFFLSRRASREHFPIKITLLEASTRFGGVLRTVDYGNLRMEAGADAFYGGQNDVAELCRELGLQEDLIDAAPCFRHFFGLKDKKFFPIQWPRASVSSIFHFLSDLRLSPSAKVRMLCEPFVLCRKKGGDESFASFIRRRFGDGFYQEVAKPLVQGVYMMDPERLSLAALFPRLQEIEKRYGSVIRSFLSKSRGKDEIERTKYLTLKQGLERLTHALVQELKGCDLRKSTFVRECAYDSGWKVFLGNGEVLHADILGLAMNACHSSKLLSARVPGLSKALSAIQYDSIATVNLGYKIEDVPVHGLGPGFLVSMEGDRYPFSSLKCLGKSADGKCFLLRAFISQIMTPEVFNGDDETLKQNILNFLKDFLGIRAEPLWIDLKRYPDALPRYETGHLERISKIEEEVLRYPGFFLAGNGFRGFGITDCVRRAGFAVSGLHFPIVRNHS